MPHWAIRARKTPIARAATARARPNVAVTACATKTPTVHTVTAAKTPSTAATRAFRSMGAKDSALQPPQIVERGELAAITFGRPTPAHAHASGRPRATRYASCVSSPYRAPVPVLPDPYAAAWRDLRRRRALACVSKVVFLLVGPFTLQGWGLLGPVVVILLGAAYGGAYAHLQQFSCPRCGRDFLGRKKSSWPFASRCAGCRISRGAPKELAADQDVYPPSAPATVRPASAPASAVPESPDDDPEVTGGVGAP